MFLQRWSSALWRYCSEGVSRHCGGSGSTTRRTCQVYCQCTVVNQVLYTMNRVCGSDLPFTTFVVPLTPRTRVCDVSREADTSEEGAGVLPVWKLTNHRRTRKRRRLTYSCREMVFLLTSGRACLLSCPSPSSPSARRTGSLASSRLPRASCLVRTPGTLVCVLLAQ